MNRGLILDIQACQTVLFRDRGCARYVASLADALIATGRVTSAVMNSSLPPATQLSERVMTSGVLGWDTATNYRRQVAGGAMAYYVMSPFDNLEAGTIVPPYVEELPLVVTLFDLIPLVLRDRYLADATLRRAYEQRLDTVRRADLLLALSEHSRRDAIEHLGLRPESIVVIGAGTDPAFTRGEVATAALAASVPGLQAPFALCVAGADDHRKNVIGLLRAWARLGAERSTNQLVVTCSISDQQRRVWEQAAADAGLRRGEVVFTGYVPEDALVAMYRAARVCIAPSLYEGFGLPIAEAAACGTPTVAARASSFPELIDDAAALFDPTDPDEMAAVIARALNDDAWRAHLASAASAKAREFTWDAVAERSVDAIDALAAQRLPRRRKPRMRLALCTPLPPTPSGVADYTERLLRPLAHHCDVDVFVEGDLRRDPTDPAPVARFPLDALGTRFTPSAYDAVVHVIGGSRFHCRTVRLAEKVPGVVWLHDLRLAGVYITEALDARLAAPAAMAHALGEHYPHVADALRARWYDSVAYDAFGIGMTRALSASARGVLVNSQVARAMWLADQAPDARLPPVTVLPFAVPEPPSGADDVVRDPNLVVALGQLSPVRMSEFAVDVIAALRRTRPEARLVFAGPAPDEFAAVVRARAAELGPSVVTVLGEVPPDEYRQWVRTAGAALQLRAFSRGESSATVADCLSAGTPVVTNVAACRELAPGVVHFAQEMTVDAVVGALRAALDSDAAPRAALPSFDDVAAALVAAVYALVG